MPSRIKFLVGTLIALSFALVAHPQTVYVSGGPNIYAVSNGTVTLIYTNSSANFESLAIGPDNVDTDGVGDAKYAYLLYACDTLGNTITRFAFAQGAPTSSAGVEIVYNVSVSLPGLVPECGRSSSAGDFYITNKSGPGAFVFGGIANTPFGTLTPFSPSPTALSFPKTMTGRGITQKYVGDMLFVDSFDNQVFRSPYATPFTTLSPFISTNLSAPVGIVNAPSLRQEFVSNSAPTKTVPAVSIFDATGAASTTTCPSGLSLPKGASKATPGYLATAPTANANNSAINDTIYLVASSNTAGALLSANTANMSLGNCSLSQVASFSIPVTGVAVAPTQVTLTLTTNATATNPQAFFFNSNLYDLWAACSNPGTATVTAYPFSQATVKSMIVKAGNGGPPPTQVPLANLGDQGFEIGYVATNTNCVPVPGALGVLMAIFNFTDNSQFNNPRTLDCTNSTTPEPRLGNDTSCLVAPTVGVYPYSGPIPGDTGTSFGGKTTNFFAVVNEGQSTTEPGKFCGYQSPFVVPNILPPGISGTFSASANTTVNVKFKLASLNLGGTCKNGPYITDATALISVAKIQNLDGTPAFTAINVEATSSSLTSPPEYNSGNQQYSFTLNLPSIFAQGGAGVYSLTTTFLSDNTTNQTILFQLNP